MRKLVEVAASPKSITRGGKTITRQKLMLSEKILYCEQFLSIITPFATKQLKERLQSKIFFHSVVETCLKAFLFQPVLCFSRDFENLSSCCRTLVASENNCLDRILKI